METMTATQMARIYGLPSSIGKYSVIYSAIRRLNQAAATEEFHLSTPDNGVTAVIHRK